MRFAQLVFRISGIIGVLVLFPSYLLESRVGQDLPPAINHPEYYYGFTGVALAWQFLFLVIATDPVRYRLAMIPAMLEKASFVLAVIVLYLLDRVSPAWFGAVVFDGTWFFLFLAAYCKTRGQSNGAVSRTE